MLASGWLAATALAFASTPPAGAMDLAPLPPAWTTSSRTTVAVTLPPGFGLGGLKVRAGARSSGRQCLKELVRLSIPFKRAGNTKGVDTPVIITGRLRGLKLTPLWGKRPALMDCIFALSLYRAAPVVLRSGVNELVYSSVYSYRNVAGSGVLSRHAYGLAIDVFEVRGPGKVKAVVKKDWVKAMGRPGNCIGAVRSSKARLLRGLICNLEKSRILSLIMTPDTDYAHRDHFHVAGLRAHEKPRRRLRYAGRPKGRKWIPRRAVRRSWRARRRARRRARLRRLRARKRARRRAARRRARRRAAHRARRRVRPRRR